MSRTLTGDAGRVSEETQTKVRDAASALGFVPNALAKGLSKSRTETIGVIMPNMNPHYMRVAAGIEEAAAERGLSILFCRTAHRDEKRDAALQLLAAGLNFAMMIVASRPAFNLPFHSMKDVTDTHELLTSFHLTPRKQPGM